MTKFIPGCVLVSNPKSAGFAGLPAEGSISLVIAKIAEELHAVRAPGRLLFVWSQEKTEKYLHDVSRIMT